MKDKNLLETENFLIQARYLFKRMNQQIMKNLKVYQVDASEIIALALLHREKEGLSMTELTRLSMMDKSMTTKVVKKLEKKSYIYRDRQNESARNYKVYLTELGLEKAKQVEQILKDKGTCFEKNFTKEEQETLSKAWECLLFRYM